MSKSKRIIFLDFMRVLALLLMIEGHTVYDFLDLSIRDGKTPGINFWSSIRGYTAPFFMLVSGAVFAYLLLSQEKEDGSNPRLKAGTRRVITLFFWGYLLNFPLYVINKIFTKDGWDRFMNIRIGDTLLTIFLVAIALYIYNSLHSDEAAKKAEKNFIRHLFKKTGYKRNDYLLKARLINRKFIQNETRKRRLFASFFYAILISIPFLIMVSLMSVNEQMRALRVDVLHIIGFGLAIVMLVYYLASKFCSSYKKTVMGISYFLLMLLFLGLHPYLNKVDFSNLPLFASAYLNNYGTKSMFTISPWTAYIMGGGIMGIWLSNEVKNGFSEVKVGLKLLGFGLVLYFLAEIGNRFEISHYGRSYYWYDSPNLVYHRMSVVLLVGSFMSFLSLVIKDLPLFLKQMSRNTLWLYVGHLVIIYHIVKPIIGYRTRFDIPIVLLFVAGMYLLMYLQSYIIEFVKKQGGYGALIKKGYMLLLKRK